MGFLWKHKVISLLIVALVAYWFMNPADRFGIARKGVVVFNRRPVIFMDLYVSPSGSMVLVEDLRKPSSVRDWLEDEVPDTDIRGRKKPALLFVGTGFGEGGSAILSHEMIQDLGKRHIAVRQMPSAAAVAEYNAARDSGYIAAVLLEID